jgi:hypothetical protein
MQEDEVIVKLGNTPEIMSVMPLVRPFAAALSRKNDVVITNAFIVAAGERRWSDVDRLMWPHMTEDERDALSNDILVSARQAVDNMHLAEKIFKEVMIKVVFALIKMI